jgi:hypothetical protein
MNLRREGAQRRGGGGGRDVGDGGRSGDATPPGPVVGIVDVELLVAGGGAGAESAV